MSKNDEMLWTSSIDSLLANPFGEVTEASVNPSSPRLIDQLKEEHRQKALALAEQIDPRNHQAILQYGVAAQAELSRFSHSILNHVQKKDVGPVGEVIHELMIKMREVNVEELTMTKKNFLARMLQSVTQSVQHILSKYQKLGVEIDRIADQLEKHRQMLFRDIMMLETLYEKNKEYFDALNIYIAAAELKLEQLRTKTIPELEKKALQSQNQMDVQEVNDMIQFADRLEKRIHDLKLSRQITIQTAPQIRLIQHVNQTLVERIQSSILTAIPLWKNQLVIALTLLHQKKAVEAQKAVTKTTNELLLRNSEMLKINTIEAAKENEEGLVSIDTLKKTQENLLETLEETLKIQQEGRMKRQQVERELVEMEEQLKQRLLTLKRAE
ncbi:toxic anion resistance protein [Anoxybacillus sp. CHMUD]|uniref:toxic anion resistance protein n=1 Tax=Anoxybacillus sp. CHMUD TaxID=2508870 RepID=UPI001492BE33|nr:toxic anion resistance protein [Anoxybacillus sp. CHMUD]NNU89823.1 toxic anion resistance protein [Anoxybacillus sp. CHMUD]